MEYLPVSQRQARYTALDRGAPHPAGGYVDIDASSGGDSEWTRWLQYWYALTRHKVGLLAAVLCGALLGGGASLFQTPVYVAGTTLEFQTPASQQQQPFEGISFLNSFDPYLLQTQIQLLKSGVLQTRVHERLVQKRSDGRSGGASAATIPPASDVGGLRRALRLPSTVPTFEDAVAYAVARLKVTPVKDSRIVEISSESTLPDVVADYLTTLAGEFIQLNMEERWSLYQSTGTWLARAQEDLKAKLEEAEKQLLTYASASGLVVTSADGDIAEQKLVQLQAEVSRAQADRIAKESVYRTAISQPAASLREVLDNGPLTQYDAKLADLRRELADASTALMPAHPKVKRLEAQIAELESAKFRESGNILGRIRADYQAAQLRERQLVADLASQSRILSSQDQKLIRYKMLQREVDTYRKLYETTLQRGKEASVASALRPVSARVVDAARVPRRPSKPDLPLNVALGLFGGLVVGVGVIVLREGTDGSIRTPGAIPLYLNLRELGVIPSAMSDPELPAMRGPKVVGPLPRSTGAGPWSALRRTVDKRDPEPVELATWNRKASLMAESFRATLTSILSSGRDGHERQVILVTSPAAQEGKSTVATNLAIALAEINQRVLLIDGDLRRPRLHAVLNQANTWGLSDLLREKTPCPEYPVEALVRKTHIPRLFVLPSGPGSVNVSRLLYSARMGELLTRLREEFDAVLIDTPPVLQVADARILSTLVDAVVLVFRAGHTTREAAAMAVEVFEADGIPVLGTVLNDWNAETMGYGYYPPDIGTHYREASSL